MLFLPRVFVPSVLPRRENKVWLVLPIPRPDSEMCNFPFFFSVSLFWMLAREPEHAFSGTADFLTLLIKLPSILSVLTSMPVETAWLICSLAHSPPPGCCWDLQLACPGDFSLKLQETILDLLFESVLMFSLMRPRAPRREP